MLWHVGGCGDNYLRLLGIGSLGLGNAAAWKKVAEWIHETVSFVSPDLPVLQCDHQTCKNSHTKIARLPQPCYQIALRLLNWRKCLPWTFLQYKGSWAWQNYIYTHHLWSSNPSYYNLTKRLSQPTCFSFKHYLVTPLLQPGHKVHGKGACPKS